MHSSCNKLLANGICLFASFQLPNLFWLLKSGHWKPGTTRGFNSQPPERKVYSRDGNEFTMSSFFKLMFDHFFLLPSNCKKLASWITSKGLQSEGLTYLSLEHWNEVKWFPREACLPSSLQSLQLLHFPNLETLDFEGIHHLISLQQLTIEECPKLENFTEERLPASMEKLYIRGQCRLRSKLEEMNGLGSNSKQYRRMSFVDFDFPPFLQVFCLLVCYGGGIRVPKDPGSKSLSKGTRGWKERLFSRNSSVSELGSEVKRELNAGIASVSRLMERLETRENNRVEDASLSNHSTDSSIAETSNRRNVEALGRNSSPGNNSPATFSAGSDSN
ncbi:hypothetical protein PIB30_051740 [Stylosanthes scabra]|uniref:Uncharacterized protein n=1 Tax=Stylosanthes scabra TaxID=79078 RepID=A0ABU6THT2_9FABA|nr:hypothetical protein [Stylosanthes scabra]